MPSRIICPRRRSSSLAGNCGTQASCATVGHAVFAPRFAAADVAAWFFQPCGWSNLPIRAGPQTGCLEALLPAGWRLLLQISEFVVDAGRGLRRQRGCSCACRRRRSARCGTRSRLRWSCRRRKGDEEPLGLNGVIDRATSGLRESGQNFETLQRQERIVDHQPAQMLKMRYREKSYGARLDRGDGLHRRARQRNLFGGAEVFSAKSGET